MADEVPPRNFEKLLYFLCVLTRFVSSFDEGILVYALK